MLNYLIMLFKFQKIYEIITANYINPLVVEYRGNYYSIEFDGNLKNKSEIWFRDIEKGYLKTNKFKFVDEYFIINEKLYKREDIYLFKPESRIKGYIKGNIFYGIKEI